MENKYYKVTLNSDKVLQVKAIRSTNLFATRDHWDLYSFKTGVFTDSSTFIGKCGSESLIGEQIRLSISNVKKIEVFNY